MNNVTTIIMAIMFAVMAYAFANLAAGRKEKDVKKIDDLEKANNKLENENIELKTRNDQLQSDLDHIRNHKVEKILNKKFKLERDSV